jgi:DNA-binding transcriptional MocR family regulator
VRSTAVDKSDFIFEVLDASRANVVVPLGSAFPSPLLFPLKHLHRALVRGLRRLDPWRTVADLTPGNPELRRQIALRYSLDGIGIPADEIVITDGGMEALNLCLQAVTRPGDAVIIESPTFYVALQALERLGLRAIEVATHPSAGVDLVALEHALQRQRVAACWLMTNFQNPIGALMSEPNKRRLVALLAKHGVPLIEDDVYGELYYGAERPKPAKAFDGDNVLHCSSFSKCLAPGYRLGWALPGRFREQVARLKLTRTLAVAAPVQEGLSDYLARGGYDRHLRQLRHTLALQQTAMSAAVLRHFPAGTKASRPEGGYFLWVEFPAGVNALSLQREACLRNIGVAPGPMFSARGEFRNCIRLNFGHHWDAKIEAAIATLGALAAAQLGNLRPAPALDEPGLAALGA